MILKYDLEKLKFAIDSQTFNKAVGLYDKGRIKQFKSLDGGYSAVVLGSSPYQVFVSNLSFDVGSCTCYLGVSNTLCKHIVAIAIFAVKNGEELTIKDKIQHNDLIFSGQKGILTNIQVLKFKKSVSEDFNYIKPYQGPSKIWVTYQNLLEEGCNRLSALLSSLPASEQTTELIIDLLLQLDKKLSHGGVDDSNGTVGEFIEKAVKVLIEFTKVDPKCRRRFKKFREVKTSFGWEEQLLQNETKP